MYGQLTVSLRGGMLRVMIALLLMAIGLATLSIGLQLSSHARWRARAEEQDERLAAHALLIRTQAERAKALDLELRKVVLAHRRVAQLAHKLSLRVPRQRRALQPPPTWADDDLDTREFDGAETFLPVSFEHDLW